jgi:two-component system, response regulator PdtaR
MKILVVEDEFILATELSDTLESEGYEVVAVADNGREALAIFQAETIDLVLCDINIKGDWDGIETVEKLIAQRPVPIIYLTALTDGETLERAKKTFPAAYIPKPYHITNLRMAIEMAINNFAVKVQPPPQGLQVVQADKKSENTSKEQILQVNEDIFIKQNYQFVKFPLRDILFLEADNIHTTVVTVQKKYVLRLSLSAILERLPLDSLIRVHRSFAVNVSKIDSFTEHDITMGTHLIPISRSFKEEFMKHFMFREGQNTEGVSFEF